MKLSVIFPVKNQSEKLFKNIKEKALPYYSALGIDFEIVIVTDASNEENQNIALEEMKGMPENVILAPYDNHPGKGHNVNKGILVSTGDYVLFMDADLATDLKTTEKMLEVIDKFDAQIASRHMKGAVIAVKQTAKRRFISWGSRVLTKMMFRFKVHDTQCGFKLFRADIAKEMANRQTIDGFAFDIEYLYFLKLNGFTVNEVPCVWTDDEDSTIKKATRTSWNFFKEMVRIKKNKKNLRLSNEELAKFKEAPACH